MNCSPSNEEEPRATMNSISLFVYVCTMVITGYAALNMSSLHLSPPVSRVQPIFDASSTVTDLYHGDLSTALRLVRRRSTTLLLLYAPWDSESLHARNLIDELSPVLSGLEVGVVAVNCWFPSGECRRRLTNVTKYPIIALYFRSGKGLDYRGRLDAGSLLAFIKRCIRPLVRIHSPQQLENLRARYSAVFVGYTLFSGTSRAAPFYYHLLNAALSWQTSEPHSDTVWAVVTDRATGDSLSPVLSPDSFTLLNWNHTYMLQPVAGTHLNHSYILEFALRMWRPLPGWLELDDVKSAVLDQLTAAGPVLFVLSARSDPRSYSAISTLRRIWMEYSTCQHDRRSSLLDISNGQINETWNCRRNTECFCEREGWTLRDKIVDCFRGHRCHLSTNPQRHCVTVFNRPHPQWFEGSERCVQCRHLPCSQSDGDIDGSAADPGIHSADMTKNDAFLDQQRQEAALKLIRGRSCSLNRTLSMVMLDTERYSQIVGRLLGSPETSSTAVIVDRQLEEMYSLDEPLSVTSLVDFLTDWMQLLRRRHLSYNGDLVADSESARTATVTANVNKLGRYQAGFVRLNAKSFVNFIDNAKQDVLLVLEAAGCGHCSVLNHVLITVDHLLSGSEIVIARVDVNNNALPWSFTMSRLPALLFLPSNSDGDSHLFPSDRAITVESVMRFVLSYTTLANITSILAS